MSIRTELNGPELQSPMARKLEPTTTPDLVFVEPETRRERIFKGAHREWEIRARYGTAESDRWTLIATPIPAADNPAAAFENGQFADLEEARRALAIAELKDDGTHSED